MAEKSNDPISATLAMIEGQIGNINTALPGKIVSYDNGLAVVQPEGQKRFLDGEVLDYPQIHNVPVSWPSFAGGQAGCKGPVNADDKCLLVFSQAATDGSDDIRQHDITDAYAVMTDLGNVGASGDNDKMTLFFGDAYVRITESGEIEISGSKITIDGQTIINGETTVNGDTKISGKVTQSGGPMSSNGIVVNTHKHPVTGSVTGPPQ